MTVWENGVERRVARGQGLPIGDAIRGPMIIVQVLDLLTTWSITSKFCKHLLVARQLAHEQGCVG